MSKDLKSREREHQLLSSYFISLGNCSQERAKEIVEKEKELNKGSSSSLWGQLLASLIQLAGAEKQFLSLAFLLGRSSVFLRKEQSLKSIYQSIQQECRMLADTVWFGSKVAQVTFSFLFQI